MPGEDDQAARTQEDGAAGNTTATTTTVRVKRYKTTPLPLRQMISMAFVLLSDSLCATLLSPFVGLYIAHLRNRPADESGYLSGVLLAMFMIGQVASAKTWGWISDTYGRRFPLICGLLSSGFSMLFFGMSTSVWQCAIFRFIQGIFNGNILVAKTMMADVTDKTNETKGFSFVSLCFGVGNLIGPGIGGLLYDPAHTESLSWLGLDPNGFFGVYPAFLPCFVMFAYSIVGVIACTFFVEESNPNAKPLPGVIRTIFPCFWREAKVFVHPPLVELEDEEVVIINMSSPEGEAGGGEEESKMDDAHMSPLSPSWREKGDFEEARHSEANQNTPLPLLESRTNSSFVISGHGEEGPLLLVATYPGAAGGDGTGLLTTSPSTSPLQRRDTTRSEDFRTTRAVHTTFSPTSVIEVDDESSQDEEDEDDEARRRMMRNNKKAAGGGRRNFPTSPLPGGRSSSGDPSSSSHQDGGGEEENDKDDDREGDDMNAALESADGKKKKKKKSESFGYKQAFNMPVTRFMLITYMVLCGSDTASRECLSLWAISSTSNRGLDMSSDEVGLLLLLNSLPLFGANFMFAWACARYRDKMALFRLGVFMAGISVFLLPLTTYFVSGWTAFIVVALFSFGRQFFCTWSYSLNTMFTARAAPPGKVGAIMGINQSCNAITRAFAPLVGTPLFAWSITGHHFYPFDHPLVFVVSAIGFWYCAYRSYEIRSSQTSTSLELANVNVREILLGNLMRLKRLLLCQGSERRQ